MIEVIGGYIGAGVFCIGMLWIWYAIVAQGLYMYVKSVTSGNVLCKLPYSKIHESMDSLSFGFNAGIVVLVQNLVVFLLAGASVGFNEDCPPESLTHLAHMALNGVYTAGTYLVVPVVIGLILYFSHKGLKIGYRTWIK